MITQAIIPLSSSYRHATAAARRACQQVAWQWKLNQSYIPLSLAVFSGGAFNKKKPSVGAEGYQ